MWKLIVCFSVIPALFFTTVNSAVPICTGSVNVNVNVGEAVDYVVSDLNLNCTDADVVDVLTFTFISGNTGGQFKVENGELKLATTLTPAIPYKFVMELDVSDGTTAVPLGVTVVVVNINNNDPVITGLPPTINLSESKPIGTLINTCVITDADGGTITGQTRVTINNPTVLSRKFVLDSISCELFVNTLLDYETTKTYTLTIAAVDLDPIAPRTTIQNVIINVLDENDNPPTCIKYYILASGTPDVQLNCTDIDSGANGVVTYELDVSNSSDIANLFEVNSVSGIVKLQVAAVLPAEPYFEVVINVKDGGNLSLATQVLVRFDVNALDGTDPSAPYRYTGTLAALYPAVVSTKVAPIDTSARLSITSSVLSMPYCERNGVNIILTESQLENVDIYDLQCTDSDGNDTLSYKIESGDTYSFFEIVNGILRLIKDLNADFTSKVSLSITVTDDSASKLSTSLTVAVYIQNENDNAPVIKNLPAIIEVSENSGLGTIVNSCSVNDKDSKKEEIPGGQRRVGWLNPADADVKLWFLDSVTCDLYVNTVLDYETVQNYTLVMTAWDLDPTSPFTVTSTFTVSILDYNDNTPVCSSTYSATVPENATIGTVLANIVCTDADSGDNAKVYFKIDGANSNEVKVGFTVGGTSGQVQIQNGLDFETTPLYDILVIAYDGGILSLSTTVTVSVIVTDVLDSNSQNTTVPTYSVKPTVGVNVISGTPSTYDFVCNFPLDVQPLYYLVNWYIDGYNIYTSPRISSTGNVIDGTKLIEADLATLGVTTVGFNISCDFRASYAVDAGLGTSIVSDDQFIGIKVLTPIVTLKQGEVGSIQIQATAPIGCSVASCNYPIYTFLQQQGYDCSVTEAGDPCGVDVVTSSPLTTIYNVQIKAGVTFQYGKGFSSSILKLRSTATYSDHLIWSNYELDDVIVNVEQDTALIEGSKCAAFVDPRIVTFDRGLLDLQEIGVYTLYFHPDSNTEVQIQTYVCDNVTNAHCVCGVAVRAGKTVYKLNKCGVSFPELLYTICDDNSPDVLKVEVLDFFYQAFLPTGTRVKIFIRPNNMNIYIYPSVMDVEISGGLCGNLTGKHKDDLVLKSGGQSSDRFNKAQYKETPEFFNSWKVAPGDDLFNDVNLAGLSLYSGGSFIYSKDAYSCSLIGSPLTGRTGTINNQACSIFTDVSRIQRDFDNGFRTVEKQDCGAAQTSGKRKRRSVPEREPILYDTELLTRNRREWKNGWTQETTETFCNQLFNESSMVSLCKDLSLVDVTSALIACKQDIELTGSANYSLDTMSAIRSQCIHELNSNDSFRIPEMPGMPPLYDIIVAAACPGECTHNGLCVDGKCICDEGFGGIDCSVDITDNPLLVILDNNGHCDLQIHQCDEMSAFGQTYVPGEKMRCRTQYFELNGDNVMIFKDVSEHTPFLESISEAICQIPIIPAQSEPGDVIAYGFAITLTNDGVAYSEPSYMAIYNSECQTCIIDDNGVTCSIRAGYCVAGGACYIHGSSYGDCYTCHSNSTDNEMWKPRENEVCIIEDFGSSTAGGGGEDDSIIWVIGPVIAVAVSIAITIFIVYYIKRKNKISSSMTELEPHGNKFSYTLNPPLSTKFPTH